MADATIPFMGPGCTSSPTSSSMSSPTRAHRAGRASRVHRAGSTCVVIGEQNLPAGFCAEIGRSYSHARGWHSLSILYLGAPLLWFLRWPYHIPQIFFSAATLPYWISTIASIRDVSNTVGRCLIETLNRWEETEDGIDCAEKTQLLHTTLGVIAAEYEDVREDGHYEAWGSAWRHTLGDLPIYRDEFGCFLYSTHLVRMERIDYL